MGTWGRVEYTYSKKTPKTKKTVKKKATKQTPRLAKNVQQNQTKKKQGSRCLCFFFSRLRERTEPRRGPGHLVPTCKGPSRSLWMQREQWLYPRVTGWGEVTVEVELGGSLYNTHTLLFCWKVARFFVLTSKLQVVVGSFEGTKKCFAKKNLCWLQEVNSVRLYRRSFENPSK